MIEEYNSWQESNPVETGYLLVESGDGWKLGEPRPSRTLSAPDGNPLPPGGCEGEANVLIAGGNPYTSDLRERGVESLIVKGIAEQVALLLPDDQRVVDMNRRWMICMATAGYDYVSPESITAVPDPPPGAAPVAADPEIFGPPTDRVRALARADFGCRDEVGHATVHATVAAEIGASLVEANRPRLMALRSQMDVSLRRVEEVLAEG